MDHNITGNDVEDKTELCTTPSRFDRSTLLTTKLKSGAKRLFKRNDDDDDDDDDDNDCLDEEAGASELFEDIAFDPHTVLEQDPNERDSLRDKLHRGAHTVAVAVKNPKRALRSRYARLVAENVSGEPKAYERTYDAELVEAHDALHKAQLMADTEDHNNSKWHTSESDTSSRSDAECAFVDAATNRDDAEDQHIKAARLRVHQVESQRDSLRIAWTMSRYVKRVRVANPIAYPVRSNFIDTSSKKEEQRWQWIRYLCQLALWQTQTFTSYHIDDFEEIPFDVKELSLAIERFAIVSAPWQEALMDVRDIYLWTDTKRTLKYFVAYWILWYLQHIATAAFGWIIYATIINRYRPTKIATIRKRVQRAENEQIKAQAWGELIQRHGQHDWVEPFLDDCGPLFQLEISDLANILEMIQFFYRWERPSKTMSTLFCFVTGMMISLFTDTNFCLKLFWFGVGGIFFFTLPMSARYPKYRRLVNPIYWLFWDHFNLAELAVAQLQEKVIMRDATKLEELAAGNMLRKQDEMSFVPREKSNDADTTQADRVTTTQTAPADESLTFDAVHPETRIQGCLKLTRRGLQYTDEKTDLFYPYSRLSEIRKVDISDKTAGQNASARGRIARRIEDLTSVRFLPSGIHFIFFPQTSSANPNEAPSPSLDGPQQRNQQQPSSGGSSSPETGSNPNPDPAQKEQLPLTVSEKDRDKIFSVAISWSNLKWQPKFSLNARQRLSHDAKHPTKYGKGNEEFDRTVKSFTR